MSVDNHTVLRRAADGQRPTHAEALALSEETDLAALLSTASEIRDQAFGTVITYSRKVFIPLTHLCRDVCHYCTFAKTPKKIGSPYLSIDEVLEIARQGAAAGCKEALFTLGEKPEERYGVAREALSEMGFESTLAYLAHAAEMVFKETGLLPHLNPGCMSAEEISFLRPTAPSMGLMLESVSDRLCQKGMPHYGSPDKEPKVRLETIRQAGLAKVPFTSGILIGIGETRAERIESLLALRDLNDEFGHIQEVIIQNFRAKSGTLMAGAPEPDLDDLLWTIAVARIILDASISLQVPPNLNDGNLAALLGAGINDWGGVSPITPDHVNPEAPWPHLDDLAQQTAQFRKTLCERLTVYPKYIHQADEWIDPPIARSVLASSDASGLARTGTWTAGLPIPPTETEKAEIEGSPLRTPSNEIAALLEKTLEGELLSDLEIARLFEARGPEVAQVCQAADTLRQSTVGDNITFVVNRNINYTNICTYTCGFCAFSKGKTHDHLRGTPYDLNLKEIQRRAGEAWERGATEVCLQGGIHPAYTGETYLDICRAIKEVAPDIHIHAFSPLEIWQGATTLGMDLPSYFKELRQAGLKTLPGTAAEILDDEVRTILCADKLTTDLWLDIVSEAHNQGINTTSTIMFGHVDRPIHWARHLRRLRDLQLGSLKRGRGRITEFVPLPFVHMESPIFTKSGTRKGPTFREAVLMHAVARLVLNQVIPNIQTSWTKMGTVGAQACLQSGANDLGGTLMNESISRAAGASNGQELPPSAMKDLIYGCDRVPRQRNTEYSSVSNERINAGFDAPELKPLMNMIATRPRSRTRQSDRSELTRAPVAGQ